MRIEDEASRLQVGHPQLSAKYNSSIGSVEANAFKYLNHELAVDL